MSKLGAILGAVGAGMLGYQKGLSQYEDGEEKKADRARKDEEYDYAKGERDRAAKLRADLAASQADVAVGADTNTGATYTDTELIAQDNRENAKFARQAAANTGEPEMPATIVAPTSYTAGGQSLANEADARFAVGGLNSRAEKARRAGAVMQQSGDLLAAEKYYNMAKTIEQEGVLAAASAIRAQAPKPNALFDADKNPLTVRAEIDPSIIETLNKTGGGAIKLPPGAYAEHYPAVTPGGMPMTETRILSKDGKVLAQNIGQTLRGMQSFMDQYKIDKDDQDAAFKGREAQDKREDNIANRRIQQQNADTQQQYYGTLGVAKVAASQPGAAPIWDAKADDFLRDSYAVTDPTTGAKSTDGNGLQFGKAVAVSRARANGGDATSAIGYALDVDQRLQKSAGGDPAKLRQLRQDYLKSIAPPPQAQPAGAQGGEWAERNAQYAADAPAANAEQIRALEIELEGEKDPGNRAAIGRDLARLRQIGDQLAAAPPAARAAAARSIPQPGGIPKSPPAAADTSIARTGESLAERSRRYEQMNTLSGTSRSKAVAAAAQREVDVKENFGAYLDKIKPNTPRQERYKALEWFSDNEDLLTNAQRKQLREVRAKAG